MHYDPIKQSLGKVFNQHPLLRILFYKLLDILLLRSWHVRKEINTLKSLMPDSPDILDAGSGFGQYSYYLARKFKPGKITSVDIKEEQINDGNSFAESIRLSENLTFRIADLTKFREPGRYDLILSVDVMEHIEKDTEVFRNMYISLKKGGILLISTPSDQGGSDAYHETEKSFIEEHVRNGYNIQDIETKLKNAGFSKVTSRYMYGKPGTLSWKISMKYPVTLLNISKLFYFLLPVYYLTVFPFFLILNFADTMISHVSGTGLIIKAFK